MGAPEKCPGCGKPTSNGVLYEDRKMTTDLEEL